MKTSTTVTSVPAKKPVANKTPKKRIARFKDAVVEFKTQRRRNRGMPPAESGDLYADMLETGRIMPKRKPKEKISNLKKPREPIIDEVTGEEVDNHGIPYLGHDKLKTNVRRRTREEALLINQRIEQCRVLMSLSMSTDDIRRSLSQSWGLRPRSIDKYLSVARKRQQKMLDRDPGETKADSLTFWSRKLQDAESRKTRGLKELESAIEFERKAKELVDKAGMDAEKLKVAESILRRAVTMKDHARRMIASGEIQAEGVQDRIDRLAGNYAPTTVALVNTKGEDILTRKEPLSRAELKQGLFGVMQEALKSLNPDERTLIEANLPSEMELSGPTYPLEIVDDEEER